MGRNWRCPQGEIDVVAEHAGATVFVEVKTRSGLRYGHPFEAITVAKLARLKRLSAAWCEAERPAEAERAAADERADAADGERLAGGILAATGRASVGRRRHIRIDAIGVVAPPGRPATVEHLEGIF